MLTRDDLAPRPAPHRRGRRMGTTAPEHTTEAPAPRKRRSWRAKFGDAFRGVKRGVRGQSSFCVHFFCAAAVLTAAGVLECELWQWCALIGCIGLVLTAELFNSCVEELFQGLGDETKSRAWPALDVAAGAVLIASV